MAATRIASLTVKPRYRSFTPAIMRKVRTWQVGQLLRIGAYARGVMKKQIRPALKGRGKAEKTVTLHHILPHEMSPRWKGPPPHEITVYVPTNGPAINVKTGRPVTRALATRARMTIAAGLRGRGEGQPPRRGPTDKLRKNIIFAVDQTKPSVVIGPRPFARQPRLIGRKTVPELLNKGGVEVIFGEPVKYGPRPYVETVLKVSLKKLRENIRKKPVGV